MTPPVGITPGSPQPAGTGLALNSGTAALTGTTSSGQVDFRSLFSPGETLDARVISLDGGKLALEMKGTRLTAETELDLKPGQLIKAQVEQVDQGRVYLKLLSPTEAADSSSKNILRGLGLNSDSQENRQALEQLLKSGLPVNRDNVALLAQAMRIFGADKAGGIAALLSFSGSLSATTALVMEAATREPALLATALAGALLELAEKTRANPSSRDTSSRILELLGKGLRQGDPLALFREAGIGLESRLAGQLTEGQGVQGRSNSSETITPGLRQEIMALLLQEQTDQRELQAMAGKALFLLDALSMAAGRQDDEILMAFPWVSQGEAAHFQIRVKGRVDRNGSFSVDPENCNISLSVDMSALGRVSASLAVYGESLKVTLQADHGAQIQALRDDAELLRQALETCGGYRLSSIDFLSAPSEPSLPGRAGESDSQGRNRDTDSQLVTIDIRI